MSQNDPRDASLEVKYCPPSVWRTESVDALATSGMFLSGLIMVTRNRYLAWPAFILGFNAWINQHPLRTKEGGSPPIANLMLSLFALVASYLPMMLKTPGAQAQTQLPIDL